LGKTNLDFTEDGEWQWHQLGYMQLCTLLQTDNHASTSPLSFLQAGCPSCRPTNSVKALKALTGPQRNFQITSTNIGKSFFIFKYVKKTLMTRLYKLPWSFG